MISTTRSCLDSPRPGPGKTGFTTAARFNPAAFCASLILVEYFDDVSTAFSDHDKECEIYA